MINLTNETILILLIALDYITGVGVAFFEKKVSSSIGRKGIFQKCGIVMCVVLCALIDSLNLCEGTQIQPVVVLFFIVNECFSIIENLGKLNVPIPTILLSCLESIKEKTEK